MSDTASTSIAATVLSAIGAKTSGVVTVSNAIVITGTTAALTAALVTADTLVVAGSALGTISDANTYDINAEDLSAIGGKTTGVVTVTNAIDINGTVAQVTAALVTSATLVVASSATATIDDDASVAEANAIAAKTSGLVTSALDTETLANNLDLDEVNAYTITFSDNTVTAANITLLHAETSLDNILADSQVTINTLTGRTAKGIANNDTIYTVANGDTGVTLSRLYKGDIINIAGDSNGNLGGSAQTNQSDISEDGQWHFASGVLAYWDDTSTAAIQTIAVGFGSDDGGTASGFSTNAATFVVT